MDIQFKQTVKIFSVFFGVLLFGVLLGVALVNVGYIPVESPPAPQGLAGQARAQETEIFADLTIDYGNGDTQTFPQEAARQGDTVFDLLQQVERRYGIALQTRNFPGLGVFIEGIHGIHNTNTSFWQFWVNDTYSQVGAEQYVLQDGDQVLWKRTSERE